MPFSADEFSPFEYSSPDGVKALRWAMVDNYGFGSVTYNGGQDLGHPPIWDYPTSFEDRRAGGLCTCGCGFWAPGHSMNNVEGQKMIREHAYTIHTGTDSPSES